MSFRNRLTLFFIVIVILPMVAVALVLFRLVADAEQGKDDARVSTAQQAGIELFRSYQERALQAGGVIGRDVALGTALRRGQERTATERLRVLARRTRAVRVTVVVGKTRALYGADAAVAPQERTLTDENGRRIGRLVVAVISADDFGRLLSRLSGLEVVIRDPREGVLTSTLERTQSVDVPKSGETKVGDTEYRVRSFDAPSFDSGRLSVVLLSDKAATKSDTRESSLFVGLALVFFLALAFGLALIVSRSLQAQIARLLDAARRLGSGDFGVSVPTEGHDEFSALGAEFNAMAKQLEARLDELRAERQRLQDAIRRIGETFASNLDRDALLEIVVQTAADAVGAGCGRATLREHRAERLSEAVRVGDVSALAEAFQAVEAAAIASAQPSSTMVGETSALAYPLRHHGGGEPYVFGVISVARRGRSFSEGERDVFHYLASQAAVSLENVELHETVQRQAVTDELTGLFNHRRFQEVMDHEIERHKRGGQDMALVMLDIDNFKSFNDTYGHQQGDLVLREVARVLRETSREIDEPARYGGEEMAVALPQTDLEGAYRAAERIRERIAALEIPVLDVDNGAGPLNVTASLGVAALSGLSRPEKDALVAAADAALYEAKRTGKNKTVRAGG